MASCSNQLEMRKVFTNLFPSLGTQLHYRAKLLVALRTNHSLEDNAFFPWMWRTVIKIWKMVRQIDV